MLASFEQMLFLAAPLGLAGACTTVAGLLAARLAGVRHELAAARHAATHDPLTGLLNRAGLAAAWPQLAARSSAVLLLDLDGFKPVNDRHGHAVGDQVLTEVATRLRYQVPGVVARLGGDEFAAVTDADPCQVGRRVAAAVARPVTLPDGMTVAVTSSVGVVVDHGGDLGAALACADAAMYRAKHTGQTLAVYDPRRDDRPTRQPRPQVRVRDLAVDRVTSWQVAA